MSTYADQIAAKRRRAEAPTEADLARNASRILKYMRENNITGTDAFHRAACEMKINREPKAAPVRHAKQPTTPAISAERRQELQELMREVGVYFPVVKYAQEHRLDEMYGADGFLIAADRLCS